MHILSKEWLSSSALGTPGRLRDHRLAVSRQGVHGLRCPFHVHQDNRRQELRGLRAIIRPVHEIAGRLGEFAWGPELGP